MKFQEMEEKLRKQKKGKSNSDSDETTEDDDDSSPEEEISESDPVNSDEGTETTTITDVNQL